MKRIDYVVDMYRKKLARDRISRAKNQVEEVGDHLRAIT